jgi:molybdopterin/thiamine biosynthesis adenylyltransferase
VIALHAEAEQRIREEGERLRAAKVLLVGTGGLGAPLGLYLAAAGVRALGIPDFDFVEGANLQRQVIHSVRNLGRPKVASAKDRRRGINPHINIAAHNVMLSSANALDIIRDYDVVADGTGNCQTRYLVNDDWKTRFRTLKLARPPSAQSAANTPPSMNLSTMSSSAALKKIPVKTRWRSSPPGN